MAIVVGSDHAGLDLKNELIEYLKTTLNYKVEDVGTYTADSVHYPEFGVSVARRIASGEFEKGLLVCGTGIGISIAANKVKGVRCALCHDHFTAVASREHNDANIVAIGSRTTGSGVAKEILKTFLETKFLGGRHQVRVEMIDSIAPVTEKKLNYPASLPGVLIFGAPASGKGTQCERLVAKHGLVHISTGDLLRSQVKDKTPLGIKAETYMNQGKLVPDDVLMGMVYDRLSQADVMEKGYLLDGFPRTKAQAEALIDMGAATSAMKLLILDVPDVVLIERVSGRRLDLDSGRVYHVKFNPPPADVKVIQRADDTEEKLTVRLQSYHQNLKGILDVFEQHGSKMKTFNGTQAPDDVAAAIEEYMNIE